MNRDYKSDKAHSIQLCPIGFPCIWILGTTEVTVCVLCRCAVLTATCVWLCRAIRIMIINTFMTLFFELSIHQMCMTFPGPFIFMFTAA